MAAESEQPAQVAEQPAPEPERRVNVERKEIPLHSQWPGSWPHQLTADEASRFRFESLLDLLPAVRHDAEPFLVPVHPGIDGRGAMTYGGLRQLAAYLRHAPALAVLPASARIAASLPSGPELAALFLALSALGPRAAFAPLNPELSEDEAAFELADLPADALIVLAGGGSGCAAARTAVALGIRVIELEPDERTCGMFALRCTTPEPEPEPERELEPAQAKESACSGTASLAVPCGCAQRNAVALVMHTSGTTRRPKVVPLTHGQLGIGALCVASTLRLSRSSLAVNLMPLFHLHGLMINVLVSAVAGASVMCAPRFDAPLFFSWLLPVPPQERGPGRAAPTWYSAVPTIHQEVLRYAELHKVNSGSPPTHSLQIVRNCSAALSPSVGARLEAALPGVTVITSYAMTESLPICSNPIDATERDLSSVGPPAGADVRVVGSDGAAVAAGESGEVIVRGLCCFKGYEQREHLGYDPNDHAFTPDGWMRTGDKGWFDDRGHLHLTGRFKELINRAGEKISPLTVEHALLALAETLLPDLSSMIVFASPHAELGEVVGVAVTCETGGSVSLSQLRRCGTRSGLLGRRWLPEMLVQLDSIPTGVTGKPARIGLAEKLQLPALSLAKSMRTIDLRHNLSNAGKAAAVSAPKKPKKRFVNTSSSGSLGASTKVPRGYGNEPPISLSNRTETMDENVDSTDTIDGCMRLVEVAMLSVTGQVVSESDDLFEAGLASITTTRMREELSRRAALVDLPPSLIYDHTTVQALAAAIFCLKCAQIPEDSSAGAAEADDDPAASVLLLTTKATSCFRNGSLDTAEAICLRGLCKCAGLAAGWHEKSPFVLPSEPPPPEAAGLLSLLLSIWIRQQRHQPAIATCNLLLEVQSTAATCGMELALTWAQLARLAHHVGDTAAAAEATCSATAAAGDGGIVPAPAALAPAVEAKPGRSNGGRGIVPPGLYRQDRAGWRSRLGDARGNGGTLQILVISGQHLRNLPQSVGDMTELRVLDASDNELQSLPDSIGELLTLQELLVPSNRLCLLPDGLADLPDLQILNFQSNRFDGLPAVVLRCLHLKTLRWGAQSKTAAGDAGATDVAEAEPTEGESVLSIELRVLEMEGNCESQLAPLNDSATALSAVLASYNHLIDVPPQLVRLGPSLRRLQLGSNRIAEIGESVLLALSGLTCLMLEANLLRTLPHSVGSLTDMRELSIFGNQLQSLPDELGNCRSLTVLDAHHNELTSLPSSMASLGKLKSLYVQSNQLVGLSLLKQRVLDHLPLTNAALGANSFDLREAFEQPSARLGLAWNRGEPPAGPLCGVFTDNFATVDHLYDPASPGSRGAVLMVAFAAEGAGMRQWASPCAAVRGAGLALDTLYLADPSNSYYMQSPCGQWQGRSYYAELIERHSKHYDAVFIIGSSMGATGALLHATLGQRVLAFGPRVNLELTHGSFLPAAVRRACTDAVLGALSQTDARGAKVSVHVGKSSLDETLQARLVDHLPGVAVPAPANICV
jgi:acyl-CoA synthetase (AMP-forming)/AMP-acid ligase II/Leucine-rich repeat (LRR) protein